MAKSLKYRVIPIGVLSCSDAVVRSGKIYRNLLELPEIMSWVHPLYALWHAGGYLNKLEAWVLRLLFLRLPADQILRVQVAIRIWCLWSSIPLPERFKPGFKPDGGDKPDSGDTLYDSDKADDDDKPANGDKPKTADNVKRTTRSSVAASSRARKQVDADNDDHNSGDADTNADADNPGHHVGNSNVDGIPHRTRSKTASMKPKDGSIPSTTPRNVRNRAKQPGPSTGGPQRDQQEGEDESNRRGRSGQRGRPVRRAKTTEGQRSAAKSGKPGARTRSHK